MLGKTKESPDYCTELGHFHGGRAHCPRSMVNLIIIRVIDTAASIDANTILTQMPCLHTSCFKIIRLQKKTIAGKIKNELIHLKILILVVHLCVCNCGSTNSRTFALNYANYMQIPIYNRIFNRKNISF